MRWVGAIVVLMLLASCASPPAAPMPAPTLPAAPTATLAPLPTPAPPTATLPAPTSTPRPVVLEQRTPSGEYFLGRAEASVTFEMFGDFQCPACGEFARSIEPTFIQQYVDTGKVKFVWHDYPWIGDESIYAAQAARCAGRQGRFWDYHNYLYAHQRGENLGQFSASNLEMFAAALGLDMPSYFACFDTGQDVEALQAALAQGISKGVDVTPSFLVNGDLRVGAPPMNRLAALMDFYLARTR
jgi:protein-disulfide isomerase